MLALVAGAAWERNRTQSVASSSSSRGPSGLGIRSPRAYVRRWACLHYGQRALGHIVPVLDNL